MALQDYYAILGVPPRSTPLEIRKAYRGLVLQFHPDRNPGDRLAEERFKEIADAYRVLSDNASRAEYDLRFWAVQDALARQRRPIAPPREEPPAPPRPIAPWVDTGERADEPSGFQLRDLRRGVALAASATVLLGSRLLPGLGAHGSGGALLLALALPWVGAPLGFAVGSRLASPLADRIARLTGQLAEPELLEPLIPALGAVLGAWGALSLSPSFGSQGILPAVIAGGAGSFIGSAFGRPFTCLATGWVARLAGLSVACATGGLTGAFLGISLALVALHHVGGNAFYEALFVSCAGGTLGAVLSSLWGSLWL